MKNYRLYYQENARFHKMCGRYRDGRYNILVPSCGYDTLTEAQAMGTKLKTLGFLFHQICVLDFSQRGIIVDIL